MTEKRTPDWEAIERAYRAGVLTNREIAKQHGITEGAIRKHAKRHGWAKDLSARVQEAVRSELVRSEVRTPEAAHQVEREIVEQAAATVVSLVREHRRDIAGQRSLAETLKGQLEEAIGSRELLEELILEDTAVAQDAPGYIKARADQQRRQMLKAVSLPGHVATLKDLSTVMRNLIPLERQAFNVDIQGDAPAPAEGGNAAATEATLASIRAFGAKLREKLGEAE